ncbi:unnamed protein product [Amoebophrya sp. A120]|nr:unnamed protein product [Amoebophrya sp. A120]|eukprot:GSA120T00016174001.1
MKVLLDTLGAILRQPWRTMRTTYAAVVCCVVTLWAYYLLDLWRTAGELSDGSNLINLDHLEATSGEGGADEVLAGGAAGGGGGRSGALKGGTTNSKNINSDDYETFYGLLPGGRHSGSGSGSSVDPSHALTLVPTAGYENNHARGEFLQTLNLQAETFAFYGDNYIFSTKTYDGADLKVGAYIYVSSELLNSKIGLDLLSKGMPIASNKLGSCTRGSDHEKRPGWFFGIYSHERGKVIRLRDHVQSGGRNGRRQLLGEEDTEDSSKASVLVRGGEKKSRSKSTTDKQYANSSRNKNRQDHTRAPSSKSSSSASLHGHQNDNNDPPARPSDELQSVATRSKNLRGYATAADRERTAQRIRDEYQKDHTDDGKREGHDPQPKVTSTSSQGGTGGDSIPAYSTPPISGSAPPLDPPEVRLFLNWSTQRSACTELASSFALPLDQWVRVGFRMDRHVAIFIEKEIVADTATANRGKIFVENRFKRPIKPKNSQKLLSDMATRHLGRGTYIGGSRLGGSFFLGFIADFTISVYDKEVVRLEKGVLKNIAFKSDVDQVELFEVAQPLEFTRGVGGASPLTKGQEVTTRDQLVLQKYVNVRLDDSYRPREQDSSYYPTAAEQGGADQSLGDHDPLHSHHENALFGAASQQPKSAQENMQILIKKILLELGKRQKDKQKSKSFKPKHAIEKNMANLFRDHDQFEKSYKALSKNHDGTLSFNKRVTTTPAPAMDNYFEGSKNRKPVNLKDIRTFPPKTAENSDPFGVVPANGLNGVVKDELESEDLLNGQKKHGISEERISAEKKQKPENGAFKYEHEMQDAVLGELAQHNAALMREAHAKRNIHRPQPTADEEFNTRKDLLPGEETVAPIEKLRNIHLDPNRKNYFDIPEQEKIKLKEKGVPEEMLNPVKAPISVHEPEKWQEEVKQAMRFVWQNYKQKTFGNDEIQPLTGNPFNWAGVGVMVFESLDTMLLMGMRKEFDDAVKNWVQQLNILEEAKDNFVSSFELNIRVIGGLLGAYSLLELDEEKGLSNERKQHDVENLKKAGEQKQILISKAREFADLMIESKMFEVANGKKPGSSSNKKISLDDDPTSGIMILPEINLKQRKSRRHEWTQHFVLSEVGTWQLEWRFLSYALKNPRYQELVDRQQMLLVDPKVLMRQVHGLLPNFVDPSSGVIVSSDYSFGSGADSFYEYLLKTHLWMHNIYREGCSGTTASAKMTTKSTASTGSKNATAIASLSPAERDALCAEGRDIGRKREKFRDPLKEAGWGIGRDEMVRRLEKEIVNGFPSALEKPTALGSTGSTPPPLRIDENTGKKPATRRLAELLPAGSSGEPAVPAGVSSSPSEDVVVATTFAAAVPGAAVDTSAAPEVAVPASKSAPASTSATVTETALPLSTATSAVPAAAFAANAALAPPAVASAATSIAPASAALAASAPAPPPIPAEDPAPSSFAEVATTSEPPSTLPPVPAVEEKENHAREPASSSSEAQTPAPLQGTNKVPHKPPPTEDPEETLPPGSETNPPLSREKAPQTYPPELLGGTNKQEKELMRNQFRKSDNLASKITDDRMHSMKNIENIKMQKEHLAIREKLNKEKGIETTDQQNTNLPEELSESAKQQLKQKIKSELESTKQNLLEWRTAMYSLSQRMLIQGFPPHDDNIFLREAKSGNLINRMEHLSCFVPGMLVLGYYELPVTIRDDGWVETAYQLMDTCVNMYKRTYFGLACEATRFRLKRDLSEKKLTYCDQEDKVFHLRPEVVESLYYMYYYTRDKKFQEYGYEIFRAIEMHTKTQFGYSSVTWKNPEKNHPKAGHLFFKPRIMDKQESYFTAETLKYLYLLFQKDAGESILSLENFVFNTEGHPIKRFRPGLVAASSAGNGNGGGAGGR